MERRLFILYSISEILKEIFWLALSGFPRSKWFSIAARTWEIYEGIIYCFSPVWQDVKYFGLSKAGCEWMNCGLNVIEHGQSEIWWKIFFARLTGALYGEEIQRKSNTVAQKALIKAKKSSAVANFVGSKKSFKSEKVNIMDFSRVSTAKMAFHVKISSVFDQ